ncbi:MAG: hypothetical protein ABI614_11810 [Planctomycetota bacterium]
MSHVTDRVSEQIGSIAEGSKEFVGEHAMPTALTVFGLGVGTGLVVASLLSQSMPSRQTTLAERLGQQLLDAMSSVVPNSLMKR